jgi:hypothetical protein
MEGGALLTADPVPIFKLRLNELSEQRMRRTTRLDTVPRVEPDHFYLESEWYCGEAVYGKQS